jgi:hypothetical protein
MAIALPVSGTQISSSAFGIPVVNLLNALGFASSSIDTTSNVSTTTTEVVSSGCFLNAVAGYRYGVFYQGLSESTVAGDITTIRLRWAYSGSFSITGSIIGTANKTAALVTHFDSLMCMGQFVAPTTGLVAVSSTIFRNVGSGNVKQNGTSGGQGLQWLILALGIN